MDVCKTDLTQAARLLREAAAYLSANAKNAKVADKARQMMKLSKKLQKKISRNQFNFNDFLSQIQQIKKMGNIKELASMIPGVGKALKDVEIDDDAFKGVEAIIYSMTPKEREHPEIINGSRRIRIAKGSGTTVQEVNRLLKQFDESKKMMKMLSGGSKLMRRMPGMRR